MEYQVVVGINDGCAFALMLYLFYLIYEFRLSSRQAGLWFLMIGLPSAACYLFLLSYVPGIGRPVLLFFCLLLPGALLCLALAKYRDARFWFTFCSLNAISLCVNILSITVFYYVGKHVLLMLAAWAGSFLLWDRLFRKAQKAYRNMLEESRRFWVPFTLGSLWLYLAMCFFERYPAPILERTEYLAVLSAFGLTVQMCYLLIFYAILTNKKYWDNLEHARHLEMELKMQDRYQTLAYMDEMTCLGNRRALMEKLQELEKARQQFCYVMMDMNGLKEVNDTYGHRKGDEFILKGAEILKEFREYASGIYRVGGDEFVILFSGCKEADVERYLQRLRKKIRKCFTQDGRDYGFAIGYAWMKDYTKETITEIMCQGDERMYEDKARIKREEQ